MPEPTAMTPRETPRPAPAQRGPAAPLETEGWSDQELAELRAELLEQVQTLRAELARARAEAEALQASASGEGSGDEADAGSKTFEREHEGALANNSRDLLHQAERALQRLDERTYGGCESCGQQIPKPRLQAFPRATLCVGCKSRQERR